MCYVVSDCRTCKCSLEEILTSSTEKTERCRLETQHVPRKVQGLGKRGARFLSESIFHFKFDANACIYLRMNCAPVCHPRRHLVSLPSWEGWCSWNQPGEHSQGGPWRHPAVGVVVASWCRLGELQKHRGTARSSSCERR